MSKCGLLTPDATPYAFCSFRAYNDNAAGKPVGNLIFLLALNKTKLAQLSQIFGMPLTLVAKQHTGQTSTLKSTLGNITVTTATVGSDKMVLDAAVPTTTGSDVLLEFTRPRPIHAVATSWSEKSLAVIGGILLLIIGVVMDELNRIRTNTAEVHSAANTIEQRVKASTKLTHAVLSQSQSASAAVEELSSSLQNIAGVAEMIAGVAKQTNLLALNATIEAARAGESGKGFSVVANEVKELAIATSAATADITSTIEKLRMEAVVMSEAITEVLSGRVTSTAGSVLIGAHRVAELVQDARFKHPDRSARSAYDTLVGAERAVLAPLRDLGLLPPSRQAAPVRLLSEGQRRRLALAIAIAGAPDLLLLDEPTNHLSMAPAGEVEDALQTTPGTVIVATHDRWLRRRWDGAHLRLSANREQAATP